MMDAALAAERAREMRLLAMRFERWTGWLRIGAVLLALALMFAAYADWTKHHDDSRIVAGFVSAAIEGLAVYAVSIIVHAIEMMLRANAAILERTHDVEDD